MPLLDLFHNMKEMEKHASKLYSLIHEKFCDQDQEMANIFSKSLYMSMKKCLEGRKERLHIGQVRGSGGNYLRVNCPSMELRNSFIFS